MEGEEHKKYSILENILQKINQKYVALPEDERKRNNKMLQVIDRIIQKISNKSDLFKNLYQNKFYGGSYYDGLKVGKPNEYDLDCLLRLPKIAEPTVVASDKPGYVHLVVNNLRALEKNLTEAQKYPGLEEKLLVGNRLSTKKVKSWMESLMSTALNGNTKIDLDIDDAKCTVNAKVVKSGPAHTIILAGAFNGEKFKIDIDLVPCFTFFDDQWPKADYKENPSKNKRTFFVVPKSPGEEYFEYWRLSFQEQERELISGYSVMKPTIRLIKKIRDRHQHKVASYFIKTVFLWELQNLDKNFWSSKPLSFVFATMLRKYSDYIEKKSIPYYWHQDLNLIGDLTDNTTSNVAGKIRNIADRIDKICNSKTDVYSVIYFFLLPEEVNMEAFQLDVPLSKKHLKQGEVKTQVVLVETPASLSSSFEETSKNELIEPSVDPQLLKVLSKLETLCVSLASEQRRMCMNIEYLTDKMDKLSADLEKKKQEDETFRNQLLKMVDDVNRKISSVVVKKDEDSSGNDPLADLLSPETVVKKDEASSGNDSFADLLPLATVVKRDDPFYENDTLADLMSFGDTLGNTTPFQHQHL